jgi:3-deoxy-D-manno-octulosonate 8-phosphate phosphatase (KDO 8-P phosphatase)
MDDVTARASRIKLLLMDCDGVLTDGRIWLTPEGGEQKSFNTHDGLGLTLFNRAGLNSGIISGRNSPLVERRAAELGVTFVKQGNYEKLQGFEDVLKEANVKPEEAAFVGDDLTDIPIMRRVGFAVAVADAMAETRSVAHYITRAKGGRGAVREVVELILKAQGRWQKIVEGYSSNSDQ